MPPPLKSPAGIVDGAIASGTVKGDMPPAKIVLLGMVAGVHIGFGACLAVMVGGAVPAIKAANPGLQRIIQGAFGLPFGLLMTTISGAELFTGNTAIVMTSFLHGKTSLLKLLKSWSCSWVGNLIGSLFIAWLFYLSGVMHSGVMATASAKASLTFVEAFVRGILCNWLVCMAVWMAAGCQDLVSKAVAIWFPVSAFIALGLEHSVANMFIIPMGMMMGAKITVSDLLLKNLLPVTLGNTVGGAIAVASVFYIAHKKL
eukprot:CAMPEP_0206038274 /NCGR_PEP_ID=MMETSP1466-20131121/3996_1 /ASSEMBLY_ACC=CAM_ASM_001126 /TAXON_ID=44452 /ORGANISM="Pavlova gyrans, Strain CCMP608" /LENGTH=257 /DNA_ID=CAMNT_0053412867 /DNA_START=209 /DNA_END=982 /DNA_ORIENTATION=+